MVGFQEDPGPPGSPGSTGGSFLWSCLAQRFQRRRGVVGSSGSRTRGLRSDPILASCNDLNPWECRWTSGGVEGPSQPGFNKRHTHAHTHTHTFVGPCVTKRRVNFNTQQILFLGHVAKIGKHRRLLALPVWLGSPDPWIHQRALGVRPTWRLKAMLL